MNEQLILSLIDKFNSSNITELDLQEGNLRLQLRKLSSGTADAVITNESPPAKSLHLGIPADTSAEKITSPIVATYYASPNPESSPFVTVGTKVKAGETLCILEAMKMMNHLEADYDCEILEVFASNGDLVEYEQALFSVKRL